MENLNQEIINEINYKNEESSMKVHTIGNYQTTVGVADYAHDEQTLDTPMDISMVTETSLSDLNDECLEIIFSLKFISITDLCAVARTNNRLMNIANRQFSLNLKTCNIRSLVNNISDAKRIIVTFGFLISDLQINDGYGCSHGNWWTDFSSQDCIGLLILVIRFCSKTLDTLQLDQCFIPENLTRGLKKLIRNLQKVCINDCVFQSYGDLFVDCKKLVELTVDSENLGHITRETLNRRFGMDNVFPKLESFRYECGDCKKLSIFLSRHKNLKILNIFGCEDSFFLLPIIERNCKHLEELSIDFAPFSYGAGKYGTVIESLQKLEHLRTLIIRCVGENITEFIPKLNSLKSLEFLELWDLKADSELTSAISQLKRLKKLELMGCKGLVNLNRLADLNQLAELTINSWGDIIVLDIVLLVKQINSLKTLDIRGKEYTLDKKMYLNLVTVVRNRPIRSQQSLAICCDRVEYGVADLQNVGDNRQIVKLG